MGYSVEVDSSNFSVEVMEASYIQPVLIDFYATWCGPCQLLKPVLEKLLKEYDFALAKVDIDQNKDLADQFSVEGVPDVRVVTQGEVLPGFVGVLPEDQIRALLSKLNLKSKLDLGLETVREAIASKNPQKAKETLDELFSKYPENPQLVLEAANFLIRLNRLNDAEKILKTIGEDIREFYPKAKGMQSLIDLHREIDKPIENELDELFVKAARLTLAEDYQGALEGFLDLVKKNRKYRNEGARKAMVSIFNLLGLEHPLTKKYQQELMFILY